MKHFGPRATGMWLLCAAGLCCGGCRHGESASTLGPTEPVIAAEPIIAAEVVSAKEIAWEPAAGRVRPVVYFEGAAADAAGESGTTQDITFDTIKFEMEKGTEFKRSMLTEAIEELMGEKVRVRGYIYPTFKKSGIKRFVLVRDNQECCFGPGAALFDCIVVEMAGDASTSYTTRPVTVEGVFGFDEMKDPFSKETRAIYHLEGIAVE